MSSISSPTKLVADNLGCLFSGCCPSYFEKLSFLFFALFLFLKFSEISWMNLSSGAPYFASSYWLFKTGSLDSALLPTTDYLSFFFPRMLAFKSYFCYFSSAFDGFSAALLFFAFYSYGRCDCVGSVKSSKLTSWKSSICSELTFFTDKRSVFAPFMRSFGSMSFYASSFYPLLTRLDFYLDPNIFINI